MQSRVFNPRRGWRRIHWATTLDLPVIFENTWLLRYIGFSRSINLWQGDRGSFRTPKCYRPILNGDPEGAHPENGSTMTTNGLIVELLSSRDFNTTPMRSSANNTTHHRKILLTLVIHSNWLKFPSRNPFIPQFSLLEIIMIKLLRPTNRIQINIIWASIPLIKTKMLKVVNFLKRTFWRTFEFIYMHRFLFLPMILRGLWEFVGVEMRVLDIFMLDIDI